MIRRCSILRQKSQNFARNFTTGTRVLSERHEVWRDADGLQQNDNEPKVLTREGEYKNVEKLRGEGGGRYFPCAHSIFFVRPTIVSHSIIFFCVGFINYTRNAEPYRSPPSRLSDWNELNPTVADLEKHTRTEQKVQRWGKKSL